ncbi:MAG: response regulator [Proteobacteria bacterium]|nr:response regulator [Pseudomonadota bacterium]MBU1451890.1 response regulator [Pseudomonadota bacterium]MBU2470146.1 response regulator [Pseudomonadota bacterium]
MKLQSKIILVIMPLVLASILTLGGWSYWQARAGIREAVNNYLATVLAGFVAENLVRPNELLMKHGLAGVKSFVDDYKKRAATAADAVRIAKSGHLFAIDAAGHLVFCSLKHSKETMKAKWRGIAAKIIGNREGAVHGQIASSAGDEVYVAHYFAPWKWAVFLAIPESEAFASLVRIRNVTIIIAAVCGIAALLLIFLLSKRYFVAPLTKLEDSAARIAEGDLKAPISLPGGRDEIGHLAESLEKMRSSLDQMFEKVKRTDELARLNAHLKREIAERERAENARNLLEEQLRQAQKMESLGTLAGGIAHDFNNILSAIIGYSELTLADLEGSSPLRGNLEQVLASSWRARNLVSQLLAFSRKQTLEMHTLSLTKVIQNNLAMLRPIIGEDIELETVLDPEAGLVQADQHHIGQVLLNLVSNSRDAMQKGGRMTIETANVVLDQQYAAKHSGVEPGPYVMLAVSDNGPGIPEAVRSRMFDPFFTTKEVGKGTGLGLAMVYGIVRQHRGNIYVYSEPGGGTTFKIYLPRVDGRDAILLEPFDLPGVVGGAETILVAEDEQTVRAVVCQALRRLGYRVLETDGGEKALALAAEKYLHLDLLLTDVVMPRMSGKDLYDRLRAHRPDLKVLYMSGYTDNVIAHHGILDSGVAFLQKPVSAASLARKVRQVLDSQ